MTNGSKTTMMMENRRRQSCALTIMNYPGNDFNMSCEGGIMGKTASSI